MCTEQTIWYPCRTHAAMKPITQYCEQYDRSSRQKQHCGNVRDSDPLVAPSLRAHLDEPCPHGCKTREPIQCGRLVKSGSKRVRRSLVSGVRRARRGIKQALR
ncbi:hypothetical protein PG993_006184 [Apiospora rasikravindrae]|uniref:Uncharacterized protein n=1 Tax=Apiospora rasikravindrae TaxID=990691 RepID=A0ABR1T6M7_9PEZI